MAVLDTIGLEVEAAVNTKEKIQDLLPYKNVSPIKSITRDASVESLCNQYGSSSIFLGRQSLRNGLKRRTVDTVTGYEIVTKPLSLDKMREVIKQLTNALSKAGEIYSPRASIHVHVGYPQGLIFQRTALAVGLRVEPLLYKIAGMGKEYRGSINHSNYARPLSLPPAVKISDSKRYALLNPEGAIKSTNYLSFWHSFGVDTGERGRYIPLRYFGMNLYSIFLRGTLEFRFFNYSNVSKHIEGIVSLSQFLCDLMVRISTKKIDGIPNISIFTSNSNQEYIQLLEELIDLGKFYDCEFKLGEKDINSIKELIEITPQPVFKTNPILTHLNNWAISMSQAQMYGLPIIEKAEDPGIIDVHNFSSTNRSLIGA